MHNEKIALALVDRCQSIARFCALAIMMLGIAVLIGWALDIGALKSVRPGWVTMKPNAALGFVLAGVSLAAAGQAQEMPGWRSVRLVLAASLTLLGLLTVGEYLTGADFGIDQLLFIAPAEPVSTAPAGRMALATAASLALTGLALLSLDRGAGRVSQAAALAGILGGVLAILGYAYGVPELHGFGATSAVALHAAAGLVAANLGTLLARPRCGVMAAVTCNSAGGVMARRDLQ